MVAPREKMTGTQPATSESNSDLRVMLSPGGAGQNCAMGER